MMNLLLHTIALEPARWLPARVSQPLLAFLPAIAAHGFRDLEIYEPHLQDVALSALVQELASNDLSAVVLSSYLDLRQEPETGPAQTVLRQRLHEIGFRKVRLFPTGRPDDLEGRHLFLERLHALASAHPQTEFLLETHDGSLADDPPLIAQLVSTLHLPNVALLFQPTRFEAAATLEQFAIQKPLIRHWHLQNRRPDLAFATLESGVVPWPTLLAQCQFAPDATLEFVPVGICQPDAFDLEKTLLQAVAERDYLEKLERTWRANEENGAR